jgi:pimeloyl-ACP methyl ester carboxylesterase
MIRWRWLSLAFASLVLLIAAACGDSEATSPTPVAATQTAAPTSASSTTAASSPGATASNPTVAGISKKLGTSSGTPGTVKPPDFDPLPGAKAFFGKVGNAGYRVELPEKWNGDLVLFAHGFRLPGPDLTVSNPPGPLRTLFIGNGAAWAASSYSENFYVPGIGADDTLALLQHFEGQFGKPKHIYLVGESMGGNVVALLMENFPDRFDGALATCGAIGGGEQMDYIVAWAMAGEFTGGVQLPIGGSQSAMTLTLTTKLQGALGTPDRPTDAGKRFISIIRNLTGGPRPFYFEGFKDQYQLNFGLLILDPARESVPVAAATNEGVVYDVDDSLGLSDAQVNQAVRRLPADPKARDAAAHPDTVPTTGKIKHPLLTLHDTGDLFVPISQEVAYRRKAEAAGAGDLLVQRAIRAPGHCKFSEAEYTTAWNDLVAWVRDGKKPAGDDFKGSLEDIGKQFTTPTRPNDPGNR